jgi:drug/metabolite transporter (DMT)-like permease
MWGEAAALLAALSWAIAAVLYKKGLSKIEPLPANFIRSLIGFLGVGVLYIAYRGTDFHIALVPLLYVVLGGLIGLGLGDLLFLGSLKYVGVVRAVPVASTYPFFTIFFSVSFLREVVKVYVAIGTVLIWTGIWLLHSEEGEKSSRLGILLALGTAIAWAASISLTALALREVDPFFAITARLPFVVAILYMLSKMGGGVSFERESSFYLGVAGFLALGVGSFLFFYSVSILQAVRATSLSSVTPLFSTIFAIIFLGERLTLRVFIGIISILLGLGFVMNVDIFAI